MPDTIDTWDVVPVDDGNSWDDSVEIEDFEELPSTEFPTFPGLEPAEDDLVYWTRDKSLILVANAIRQKAGTSERLVWPLGYRDAILGLSSIGSSQSSTGDDPVGEGGSGQSSSSQGGGITITPVEGSDLMPMFVQKNFSGGIADTSGAVSVIKSNVFANSLEFAVFPSAVEMDTQAFVSITTLRLVSIPNITEIKYRAFYGCYRISSLTTGQITSIGNEAFYSCYELERISLLSTTSIGRSAFYRCEVLESAIMPALTNLGSCAFMLCYGLKEADLGPLLSLSTSAFYGCRTLSKVSASNLRSVGDGAFQSCGLSGEVQFPALTTIYSGAFANCSSMETFYAPLMSSLGTTGTSATAQFRNCTNLRSVVVDPSLFENLSYVPSLIFAGCSKMSSFSFPNAVSICNCAFQSTAITTADFPNVKYINRAFQYCQSLVTINIPNLESISTEEFRGCAALSEVTLSKVSVIQTSAFMACGNLAKVTFPAATFLNQYALSGTGVTDVYLPGSAVCSIAMHQGTRLGTSSNVKFKLHVPPSLYSEYAYTSSYYCVESLMSDV